MGLSTRRERVYQIMAIVWALLAFGVNIYYILNYGKWIVDSDMSAEIVLADLLNKEKSILSENWFYGNELRVFHLQWFFRLGLLIFPNNWNCARAIGMGIFYILFFVTACLFAKNCHLKYNKVWFAATLLWPIGFWYHFLGTWGGYYLVYIWGTLACLACTLKISNETDSTIATDSKGILRHSIVPCVVGVLVAFCSGLNGIRQMQVFFFPSVIASITLLVIRMIQRQKFISVQSNKMEIAVCASTVLFFLANLIGYVVNTLVLSKHYTFRHYGDVGWVNSSGVLLSRFEDFFKLFGFTPNIELFSVGGVASGIGLLIALVIVLSALFLLKNFHRITVNDQFLLLVCIVAFVVNGFTLSYLSTDYAENYWLPNVVYGWILVFIVLKYMYLDFSQVATLLLALCISLCSYCTIRYSVAKPYRGSYQLFQVSQKLRELGLNKGCSLFWSSDCITEMTDGEIEMWTMLYEDDSLSIYPLFQVKSHSAFPEGKFFVLLPDDFDVKKINDVKDMNITDSFSMEGYTVTIIN